MESRINVCVRVKPLKSSEESNTKNKLWDIAEDNSITNTNTKESFSFDKVFGGEISTEEIFEQNVKKHIESAVKGINVTIFAYGQTSSGKTFTMRGCDKQPGLIPLTISEIFKLTKNSEGDDCKVTCSYMEIYNESVNDLLDETKKNLDIRESISQGVYIQGLTAQECKDEASMIELLNQGEESRITAATNLNEQSSRSHSVFRFNIEVKEKVKGQVSIRTSQFNLVDLAGSEGVSRTKAEGIRFREGSNINKSLLALSKVIHRLSSNQKKGKLFINYRDSKLTRILQPSLGGNSKTTVICTLSQLFVNYQESVKTLLFGQMAKNVKTVVKVNEIVKNKDAIELKAAKKENEELKDRIHQLELRLKNNSSAKKQKSTPYSTPQVDSKNCKLDLDGDVEMEQKARSNSNLSSSSTSGPTIAYLKEQVAFLTNKINEKNEEIERKDVIINKIQAECSEIEQKFELADTKEAEARLEIEALQNELQKYQKSVSMGDVCMEEEKEKPDQLTDGIKCFSFNCDESNDGSNILSSIEKVKKHSPEKRLTDNQDKEGQLRSLLSQREKTIDKLNRELELLTDNSLNMKSEIRLLHEAEKFKTEELESAEKEIQKLKEEIKFFQESNKDLVNSIDEVERALHEVETSQGVRLKLSHDGSNYSNSQDKLSKRTLVEENDRLSKENLELTSKLQEISYEVQRVSSDKTIIERKLETAESNIEILNETLEFMGNENIIFKDQLVKQKERLNYKRKEKDSLETDLEEIKKKYTASRKRAKKAKIKESKSKENQEIESLKITIADLQEQLSKKEKEYDELKKTIDKVKKIKSDYDNVMKKEKETLKEEYENQKKSLLQEIDEYKYKSYNVLNDNATLKKKIKSLNNTILNRDIEIKTHKQDKEKYMSEIVEIKISIKEREKEVEEAKKKYSDLQKQELTKQAKLQGEVERLQGEYLQGKELCMRYKKFVKDMDGVLKLVIKEQTAAIANTQDKENLNTVENVCLKVMHEQKHYFLKVMNKIKKSGFIKMSHTKAHPAIKVGYSEEEPSTTDDPASTRGKKKRVKISE